MACCMPWNRHLDIRLGLGQNALTMAIMDAAPPHEGRRFWFCLSFHPALPCLPCDPPMAADRRLLDLPNDLLSAIALAGGNPAIQGLLATCRRLNAVLRPQLEAAWLRPAAAAAADRTLGLLRPSRFAGLRSVALHSETALACDLERLQVGRQGRGGGAEMEAAACRHCPGTCMARPVLPPPWRVQHCNIRCP